MLFSFHFLSCSFCFHILFISLHFLFIFLSCSYCFLWFALMFLSCSFAPFHFPSMFPLVCIHVPFFCFHVVLFNFLSHGICRLWLLLSFSNFQPFWTQDRRSVWKLNAMFLMTFHTHMMVLATKCNWTVAMARCDNTSIQTRLLTWLLANLAPLIWFYFFWQNLCVAPLQRFGKVTQRVRNWPAHKSAGRRVCKWGETLLCSAPNLHSVVEWS